VDRRDGSPAKERHPIDIACIASASAPEPVDRPTTAFAARDPVRVRGAVRSDHGRRRGLGVNAAAGDV